MRAVQFISFGAIDVMLVESPRDAVAPQEAVVSV